ncbi:MAG TPA: FhaA domain-containing protein [Ktedonobacteraceae bacterium]|nr:FhaA domain-containing protein [Ktedonobacteraceae bacterium]
MKARQNRLARINSGIEGLVDKLFSFIAPSAIQPTDIARKLESAMEDGSLHEKAGHWLAPNVYDVNLSIKDHQRLSPSQAILVKGWQETLIAYAKKKHYTLKTDPVIRLHGDSKLRMGLVRIEAKLEDARHMGTETISSAGISETQQLDPAQLALLRAQLTPGQPLPGIDKAGTQAGNRGWSPSGSQVNQPFQPPAYPLPPTAQSSMSPPPMPWARLIITLPQGGQRTFQIEKPEINIGRQLSNDIIVEDKRVSRDHAKIVYGADGRFNIMDLSSTNGIILNGKPMTGKGSKFQRVLSNGDRFTIGSYDFYFERR